MKSKSKPRRRFDWSKIKQEYLSADDTVNVTDILHRNGITGGNYKPYSIHTSGWPAERKALRERELEAVKKKLVKATADEFEEYIRLLDVTRKQIAMFLRGNMVMGADGAYILANDHIGKLSEASLAIERVLKSHRLIRGKTTDNVGVVNYHMAIVKLLEETKAGKIVDLGEVAKGMTADKNDNDQ